MKIAIIGSQTFPVVQCAVAIASFIREFPPGTEFLTRGSKGFDVFAAECARIMKYKVETYPGKGGGFNFERDVAIVEAADRVCAFFDPEHIGEGGTQHVIDKALDQRKPVDSYTAHGRDLILIGSDDGDSIAAGPSEEPRGQAQAFGQDASQSHEPQRGSAPQGRGQGSRRSVVSPGSNP